MNKRLDKCLGILLEYFAGDKLAVNGIKHGEYQISPESLFHSFEWRQVLCSDIYISNLVGVIIDEAHCIKKW